MKSDREAKHTPGEWKLEVNEKAATIAVLGKRTDGNVRPLDGYGVIAIVNCAEDPDAAMFSPMRDEDVANARVMGAASNLLAALRDIEPMFRRPGENANDQFERIADLFYRETGYLRPGKDCVIHDHEVRKAAWEKWFDDRLERVRAAIAKAGG